jgi:glycosyltransferase involved in cell wall biosynthesis
MSAEKLVSVVMAAYNAERHVAEAVQSVLHQTYHNLELHVVDDGSTDGTSRVLSGIRDPRIFVHRQANAGQARAKNKGICESRGDFVAFLDSDDVWMPNKLERQLPILESSGAGVVYSDELCIDDDGRPVARSKGAHYSGAITAPLFIDNFITFNSTVVRRECFDSVGVFDETLAMGIDWDLWLRISTRYTFAYLDEPTFYYRLWQGQMSHNFERRYECAFRIMRRFLQENPGRVDSETVRLAWAHTHRRRGALYAAHGEPRKAFRCYVESLRVQPTYAWAWRGVAKLILQQSGLLKATS